VETVPALVDVDAAIGIDHGEPTSSRGSDITSVIVIGKRRSASPSSPFGRTVLTRGADPSSGSRKFGAISVQLVACSRYEHCSFIPSMAGSDATPRPLSSLRLFCIAFILTFVGVTANLWMLHWLPRLIDQRDELVEPSGGASRLPLLASIAKEDSLKMDSSLRRP
jgi:hypothetical protein